MSCGLMNKNLTFLLEIMDALFSAVKRKGKRGQYISKTICICYGMGVQ